MDQIQASTVSDLREGLGRAWDELATAIDSAGAIWDQRVLESEDAVADAWSPRLAAWHAIAGERIRAAYIQHLVIQHPAHPGDMMAFAASPDASHASVDALRAEFRETRTPAEMHKALTTAREAIIHALLRLTDADLEVLAEISDFARDYVRERAQTPTSDVRGSLLHGIVHLSDHARQILSAASARV